MLAKDGVMDDSQSLEIERFYHPRYWLNIGTSPHLAAVITPA